MDPNNYEQLYLLVFRNKILFRLILSFTKGHSKRGYNYYELTLPILVRMKRFDLIKQRLQEDQQNKTRNPQKYIETRLDFSPDAIWELCQHNLDLDLLKQCLNAYPDEFGMTNQPSKYLWSGPDDTPQQYLNYQFLRALNKDNEKKYYLAKERPFALVSNCLKSGSLEIIRFLIEVRCESINVVNDRAIFQSLSKMTPELLLYIDNLGIIKPVLYDVCKRLVRLKKFDLFNILFQKYFLDNTDTQERTKLFYTDILLIQEAFYQGDLSTLQMLYNNFPPDAKKLVLNSPMSNEKTVTVQHWECFKWLHQNGKSNRNLLNFNGVLKAGLIEAYEYIIKNFDDLVLVDQFPDLETLKYFYLQPEASIYVSFLPHELDQIAIKSNNLDWVKYIHENVKEGFTPRVLDCKYEIVEYILANRKEGFNDIYLNQGFHGDLRIVKLLMSYEKDTSKKIPIKFSTRSIENCAKCGYLEVVKFLNENRFEGFTYSAISMAAAEGHDHIIRYLGGFQPIIDTHSSRYSINWFSPETMIKMFKENYLASIQYCKYLGTITALEADITYCMQNQSIIASMSPESLEFTLSISEKNNITKILTTAITTNSFQLVRYIVEVIGHLKVTQPATTIIETLVHFGCFKMLEYIHFKGVLNLDEQSNSIIYIKSMVEMKVYHKIIEYILSSGSKVNTSTVDSPTGGRNSKTPLKTFLKVLSIISSEKLYYAFEHFYNIGFKVEIPSNIGDSSTYLKQQKLSNKYFHLVKSSLESSIYKYYEPYFKFIWPVMFLNPSFDLVKDFSEQIEKLFDVEQFQTFLENLNKNT
ncbi:hypothetical protein DLAC_10388 [Tieghemostelium lacteum]|uniref:Ankyrin repeat-containing protein n=1 Tax=Tieghemostelium lacteum TaxID=361077 RepID=A0A151Z5G0_TIELA|nr:hypothetical protein DLAC_10388 [Tieghemostelium lacteum]|eukprot:KYQ89147.1 hypothetical protein DLAC_10388 [Tieghemostelium lacteum]